MRPYEVRLSKVVQLGRSLRRTLERVAEVKEVTHASLNNRVDGTPETPPLLRVQAFDFGVDYNFAVRQEAEPTQEELAERVVDLHRELYDRGWKAKQEAKKASFRAVKEKNFE